MFWSVSLAKPSVSMRTSSLSAGKMDIGGPERRASQDVSITNASPRIVISTIGPDVPRRIRIRFRFAIAVSGLMIPMVYANSDAKTAIASSRKSPAKRKAHCAVWKKKDWKDTWNRSGPSRKTASLAAKIMHVKAETRILAPARAKMR